MIRADGSNRSGRQRSHPEPCRHWTGAQRRQSRLWEEPIKAQLRGLEVSDVTIAQVVAALTAVAPVRDDLGRARRERQRRELATAYAAGKLTEASFLSAVATLNAEGDTLPPVAQVTAADVSRFLRRISDTIAKLDTAVAAGDIAPNELAGVWAELTHAIYQRITVTGATFVGAELTPAAKAHGFQVLLPEEVEVGEANWRARPDSNRRSPA